MKMVFENKGGGVSLGREVTINGVKEYVKTGFDLTRPEAEKIESAKQLQGYLADGSRMEFLGRKLIDKFMDGGQHTPVSTLGIFPFSTEISKEGVSEEERRKLEGIEGTRIDTVIERTKKYIPSKAVSDAQTTSSSSTPAAKPKKRPNLSLQVTEPVLDSRKALSELNGTSVLHIMSKGVEGYTPLGGEIFDELRSPNAASKNLDDLIRILAISHFFGNNDALGAGGDNCGRDKDGNIVIIDTGQFFALKPSDTTRNITLGVGDNIDLILPINELCPEHQAIFLDTLKGILATTTEEYRELLKINKRDNSLQNISSEKTDQLVADFEARKVKVQSLVTELEKEAKISETQQAGNPTGVEPPKGPAHITMSPRSAEQLLGTGVLGPQTAGKDDHTK